MTGAYSAQKTALNISLTAIGLLWTSTDFLVKGVSYVTEAAKETGILAVFSLELDVTFISFLGFSFVEASILQIEEMKIVA